jgi:phosphatidylglycerol---prolipoprotein diacylglyceryl transferase
MDGGSNSHELGVKTVASNQTRFQPFRRAKTQHGGGTNGRALHVVTFGCEAAADLEPQALGLTYWFDAAAEGEPYPVTIRFAGQRIGVKRRPGPLDSFNKLESVDEVVPGSGPIAITTRIFDIAPGRWHVTAAPVRDARLRSANPPPASTGRPSLHKASSSGTTAFAPVIGVRAPGARLGVWPALVGLGVAVALTTQAVLAKHVHPDVVRVLLVSFVASLVGLLGTKLYFMTGHYLTGDRPGLRGLLLGGMCIQGFVLGAIGALVLGAQVAGVPVGPLLDITAPGLLIGMTVGRFGCFFGGCCAGRPTASRWGLWSSDRRLGVRRVPSQLLESAVALVVGLAALLAVRTTTPHPAGVVFVGTIAASAGSWSSRYAPIPATPPTAAPLRLRSPGSSLRSILRSLHS